MNNQCIEFQSKTVMQILRNTQKGLFFKFVLKFIYKSVLALRLPQLIIRPAAINE